MSRVVTPVTHVRAVHVAAPQTAPAQGLRDRRNPSGFVLVSLKALAQGFSGRTNPAGLVRTHPENPSPNSLHGQGVVARVMHRLGLYNLRSQHQQDITGR